jgi:biotin carboxylase
VRRVLVLATTTGYQTRAFGDAAARLGVALVFATDRCHLLEDPWQDAAIPIRFHDENGSVAAILDAARTRPIDGVLVVGDRPAVIGARVMLALGLPGHSPDAVASAGHKRRTRERLRDAGLAVPWFLPTSLDVDPRRLAASLSYPAIVKPLALSGSRGVMRADDAGAFVRSFERLRALLRSPEIRAERNEAHDAALVEGFIPGREYALEGVLEHGVLRVLALFDKPDPLDGPFFEETIYVTPSSAPDDVLHAIASNVARAADAIGLRHGPVHAECRVNDAGVFVLEVAARPIGGLCARALTFQAVAAVRPDSTLEELLLRHALGESTAGWVREPRASGVMMIPIPRRGIFRRAEHLDEARATPGVYDLRITAKADQLLVPLPESASYLGFIFARGPDPGDVEGALRDGHARLRFVIDAELPVLGPSQIHYNERHG